MSKLKATRTYLNPLEKLYSRASTTTMFDENSWRSELDAGRAEEYASALILADKNGINADNLYEKYGLKTGDKNTFAAALYTELGSDNTVKNKYTFVDAAGQEYTEELTDYEYNLKSIQQHNIEYKNKALENSLKELNNQNWFTKAAGTIASAPGEIGVGLLNWTNDVAGFIYGLGKVMNQRQSYGVIPKDNQPSVDLGEGIKEFQANQSDTWIKLFGESPEGTDALTWAEDSLADFESKYTYVRDENGNLTTFGEYWSGAMNTIAAMIPSMVVSFAGAPSGISQAIFYGGFFASDVSEQIEINTSQNLDISTETILANATIKTALQYAVEWGLGKVFGVSALDRLVYGKGGAGKTAGKFATTALKDLGFSALQEGTEEVLQEFTDLMTNKAFEWLITDEYAYATEGVSLKTFTDAFFLGALLSVVGGSVQVGLTSKVTSFVTDDNGNISTKKLGKLASYGYNINLETFTDTLAKLSEQKPNPKNIKQYTKNFEQAVKAYRVLTGVYTYMGNERFTAANELLTKVRTAAEQGKFDDNIDYSKKLKESFKDLGVKTSAKLFAQAQNQKFGEAVRNIETADFATDEVATDKFKSEVEKLKKAGVKNIVEVDGGVGAAISEDGETIVAPTNMIRGTNYDVSEEMLKSAASNYMIEELTELIPDEIFVVLKGYFSEEQYNNLSRRDIVTMLLFDSDVYTATLLSGNKDVYKFLSHFINMAKNIVPKNVKDAVFKQSISKVITNWVNALTQYSQIHPEVDYTEWTSLLTKDTRTKVETVINNERIAGKLYNRVVLGQLTDGEKTILKNRVNSLPVAQSVKTKLEKQLFDSNAVSREKGVNKLLSYYAGLYYKNYDGKTYLPDTSIANRAFNNYIKRLGFTAESWLNRELLTQEEALTVQEMGNSDGDFLRFRNEQLKQFTGYEFKLNHGKITVFKNDKAVGFSNYARFYADSDVPSANIKIGTRYEKRNSKLRSLLNSEVPRTVAYTLSIDDVILNHNLLSGKVHEEIAKFAKEQYDTDLDEPNLEFTYLYLRSYFLETENKAIVLSGDGEFVFADLTSIESLFKTDTITDRMSIGDIIDEKYIPSGLTIRFVSDVPYQGAFVSEGEANVPGVPDVKINQNVIYVNRAVLVNQRNAKFVIAHELQHAIQYQNNMDSGITNDWNTMVSTAKFNEIVKQIKTHVPELFKSDATKNDIIRTVIDFVYYGGQGEISANGLDGSTGYKFVPIVVKDNTTVTFPWGYSFTLSIDKEGSESSQRSKLLKEANGSPLFNKFFKRTNSKLPLKEPLDESTIKSGKEVCDWASGSLVSDNKFNDLIKYFLTDRNRNKALAYLYSLYGQNLTVREFLDSTIPAIVKDEISEDGKWALAHTGTSIEAMLSNLNVVEVNIQGNNDIKVINVPVKQIIGYVDLNSRILVKAENLKTVSQALSRPATLVDTVIPSFDTAPKRKSTKVEEDDGYKAKKHKYIDRIKVNGKYKYIYPKDERVNVTKSGSKDTPLEAFYNASEEQGRRRKITPELKELIMSSDRVKLDEKLQRKIDNGTLTDDDVLTFMTTEESISDETFSTIMSIFYPNNPIKTQEELNRYMYEYQPKYYALGAVLKQIDAKLGTDFYNSIFDASKLDNLIESIKTLDLARYRDAINIVSRYNYIHGEQLRFDDKYTARRWLQDFDGTIESGYNIGAKSRELADFIRKGKASTSQGKSLSLDAKIGTSGRTYGEAVADTLGDARRMTYNELHTATMLIYMELNADRVKSGELSYAALQREFKETTDGMPRDELWDFFEELNDEAPATLVTKSVMTVNGQSLHIDQELIEQITGDDELKKIVKKKYSLVQKTKNRIITLKGRVYRTLYKDIYSENSDILNKDLTLNESYYKDYKGKIDYNKLQDAYNRIVEITERAKRGDYTSRSDYELSEKRKKDFAKALKAMQSPNIKISADSDSIKVIKVQETGEVLKPVSNLPPIVEKIFDSELHRTHKTEVQKFTLDNERHYVRRMKDFIDNNVDILNAMTQSDVDEIVDFYLHSSPVLSGSEKARFESSRLFLLSYIYLASKQGTNSFAISNEIMNDIEAFIKNEVSNAMTIGASWRTVLSYLNKVNPDEEMHKAMRKKSGLPEDEELDKLSSELLTKIRQNKIEEAQEIQAKLNVRIVELRNEIQKTNESNKSKRDTIDSEISSIKKKVKAETNESTRKKLQSNISKLEIDKLKYKDVSTNPKSILRKIRSLQATFMLSGPGTIMRSKISNIQVKYTSALADVVGNIHRIGGIDTRSKRGKDGTYHSVRYFKNKGHTYGDQYQLFGTAPSEEVQEFVKSHLIDNDLLSLIADSGTRYEPERLRHRTSDSIIADMISDKLNYQFSLVEPKTAKRISKLYAKHGHSEKVKGFLTDSVEKGGFIRKLLSDDKWINERTIWYAERMIQEDIDTLKLEKGLGDAKVLEIIASAYTRAAMDYMHRPNFISKVESSLYKSLGEPGMFLYKQVFPFMSTSWNWFLESLNYSPVGLAKAIVKVAKLENTVAKAEYEYSQGKTIDNPRFAEYIARQELGKGVIGSFGTLVGMLLVGFGVVKFEEDDDERKIVIGNIAVDISDLYASQGIILGMSLVNGIKNEKTFGDMLGDTSEILLHDSALETVINTFRYSNSVSDFVSSYSYNVLNTMVPNFIKTFARIARKYEIRYSDGVQGSIERTVASIPFADRFLASKVDVYTGEKQSVYNLTELFSSLLPVDVEPMDMSSNELIAISHGVTKTELSGNYREVDLSASEVTRLNQFYGKLNSKSLSSFYNNRVKQRVQNEDGSYSELYYSQMTDKQKGAATRTIMSGNSAYAKIYILTSSGEFKYYASKDEYEELRKLGIIKNIYRKTDKLKGFVKN